MWLEFEEIDIPDPPYHKEVSQRLVEGQAKVFCPGVAGFLAANIRKTGKIAMIDGRHRSRMAKIAGYTGWWFMVFHELTFEEEAKLFEFFTERKNMTQTERIKAQLCEGNEEIKQLQAVLFSEGYNFGFAKDDKRRKIDAAGDLLKIFRSGGEEGLRKILRVLSGAWIGNAKAVQGIMLRGLWAFLSNRETVQKIDLNRLTTCLNRNNPDCIIQSGRRRAIEERIQANYGIASHILTLYNKEAGTGRIRYNFTTGVYHGKATVPAAERRTDLPKPSPAAQKEIMTRDGSRKPVSDYLRSEIGAAISDGFTFSQIEKVYRVGRNFCRGVKSKLPKK